MREKKDRRFRENIACLTKKNVRVKERERKAMDGKQTHFTVYHIEDFYLYFSQLGEFGDVYKGELTCGNGKKIPVAVKTLKVCTQTSQTSK